MLLQIWIKVYFAIVSIYYQNDPESAAMQLNHYTIKAQEAVQNAVRIAENHQTAGYRARAFTPIDTTNRRAQRCVFIKKT